MYNNFDYKDSINRIKSALFDIYENQEFVINSVEDEKEKQNQTEKYASLKNSALSLIENLNELYEKKVSIDNKEINTMIIEKEEEPESAEAKIISSEPIEIDEKVINEEVDDDFEDTEIVNNESSESNYQKFYLDDRNGDKTNFAYVPIELFNKIKGNSKNNVKNADQTINEEENVEEQDTNKFYKDDNGKVRGIIVRNDQYMKLSLSYSRQSGVIKEAKQYRIMQAKKSREKLQAEALEKGKIELNI